MTQITVIIKTVSKFIFQTYCNHAEDSDNEFVDTKNLMLWTQEH